MNIGDEVELIIKKQGKPRINKGVIVSCGKDIVAIDIDLHSKNCSCTYGSDGDKTLFLIIGTTEDSEHILDTEEEHTFIVLPQFKGWDLHSKSCARYSLRICLIK